MPSTKRRFYYHCTETYVGPSLRVQRRVPEGVRKGLVKQESMTPRLCVAPCVASCFSAVLFRGLHPVHVYRTPHPIRGIKPVDVWDAFITGERWVVPPFTLEHFACVPTSVVAAANYYMLSYVTAASAARKTGVHYLCRTAHMSCCAVVLPDMTAPITRRVVAYFAPRIGDPFSYLAKRTVECRSQKNSSVQPKTISVSSTSSTDSTVVRT